MQLTLFLGLSIAITIYLVNGLDAIHQYMLYYYAYYIHYVNDYYDKYARCPVTTEQSTLPLNVFKTWDSRISNHMNSRHDGWIISEPPVGHWLCYRIVENSSMFNCQ
jgi:hypothetical protein